MRDHLRNIAIIAHVDHGKTTLVDGLLKQTNTLARNKANDIRIMDSNAIEQERGITILAKNTGIRWEGYHINLVDTPGHADFGGEVERILSMVDSVLLLVDAVDGPMPQTRFVTQKAFHYKLKPIVVVNKIDRDGARPDWVVDQMFDLFDALGATDDQLDFPVVYTSALAGTATLDLSQPGTDFKPLLETIVSKVSPPQCDENGPLQLQISALDYSSYVGTIGIGRIHRGNLKPNTDVVVVNKEGQRRNGRVLEVFGHLGLERIKMEEASAGDIVAITGIDNLKISDTLCDKTHVEGLPALSVDEPTISMLFKVNDSPFAGKSGKYLTSRQIRDRLAREMLHNVALKVEDTVDPDSFLVSGRGELHLSILIENMRREGYELAVGRPRVIIKTIEGVEHEPYERLVVDVESNHQGKVMELIGLRKGDLQDMVPDGNGRVKLEYFIPARGLIGFHTEFLTLTSGSGLISHVFDSYRPMLSSLQLGKRQNGALIAHVTGTATPYSLFNIQARGQLFIGPQIDVYEGQVVGIHSRDNDLVVNITKEKQLTNMRASGKDENVILTPALRFSLEQALDWIDDDELVEVTPGEIRIRKIALKPHERKRSS